ncbi:hypothetical protein B7494_g2226 [Chlorociboria aeruginascens]|nr:hypothetical protein B7494_g2226 [Chlorociboria aeruginascens]
MTIHLSGHCLTLSGWAMTIAALGLAVLGPLVDHRPCRIHHLGALQESIYDLSFQYPATQTELEKERERWEAEKMTSGVSMTAGHASGPRRRLLGSGYGIRNMEYAICLLSPPEFLGLTIISSTSTSTSTLPLNSTPPFPTSQPSPLYLIALLCTALEERRGDAMAAPNRLSASGVGRTASTRTSMHTSMQQDDDEYDVEAVGISEGLRPADPIAGHRRLPSHNIAQQGRRTPPPRLSSTTKPNSVDSFALRHDGTMGPVLARNTAVLSMSRPAPSRSSSVSTDTTFVRAESPYHGPSGPSHPYHMYPQESRLARTASITTTPPSVVPAIERSYAGPSGPTHPYGMYSQNIVPSETESVGGEPTVAAPIHVGFPGLNHDYQRRLGPEGEEIADIIGPDGHTEQLPPYTKYAEDAFSRKTRPSIQLPLAGAGGIGLATRNPEFESGEDLSSPESIMSDSSNHLNTAALSASEKPPLKKWQMIARRKVCGIIPVWTIAFAAILLVLFGIILASVLAALRLHPPPSKQHHATNTNSAESQSGTVVYTTMTTTFDVSPISTLPPNLPSLPTGTFALNLPIPSTAPNSCLVNTAQSAAWSCAIPIPVIPLQMIVADFPGSSDLTDKEVTIEYCNYTVPALKYGAQPPIMTQRQVMDLVTDTEDIGRGPAWWFQAPYNKVVVLPEGELSMSSGSKAKRDFYQHATPPDFQNTRFQVAEGDKPWVCYWNGTLLETFIYVNQLSSDGASNSSSLGTATTSATSTYASSVPTSSSSSSSSSAIQFPHGLPTFPMVLKIEERRIPNAPQAVCVQHLALSDGTLTEYLIDNNQVIVSLNETVSDSTTLSTRPIAPRNFQEERDIVLNERDSSNCGCVWLVS